MRLLSTLLLVSSALSLAACAGGGDALKTSSIASGVGSPCPISEVDNTPDCPGDDDGGVVVNPPAPDSDSDGIPDVDDTDGGTGSGAGGNTTSLANGNRTIVLRESELDEPTTEGDVALSTLTTGTATTLAATTEEILSANKPDAMKINIDSKSAINGNLAVATNQTHYVAGTRDIRWVMLGHTTFADARVTAGQAANRIADANALANAIHDPNGNPLRYNRNTNKFYYKYDDVADASGHKDFYKNQAVDHKADFYWNQLVPFMNAKANGGTKTNYREYRAYSNNKLDARDEILQVWAFKDSYATHYINGVASGLPKQQAWAFGGREATNVPTGGKGEYRGRWVGTAVTSNFIKPDGAETDPNGKWMVQGNSRFTADFDTSKINGTLTTESWTTNQNNKPLHTWFTGASGQASKDTGVDPNYDVIYDTQINIDATLHNNGTANAPKNQFTGTASLSGDYISTDNPAYGGLYGTNGDDLTGAFNVFGVLPQPMGGSTGIIDGREGHVKINGVFNANCTNPGGVCAP